VENARNETRSGETDARGDELEEMQEKVVKMPNKYRSVFEQALKGSNEKEIAEELLISPGTVKSRLHRGKKILLKLMNVKEKE